MQGWGQLPTKRGEMVGANRNHKDDKGGLWSEGLGVAGCSGSLKGRSQSPVHISELRLQDWTRMVFLGLCGWCGGPNSVPSLGFKRFSACCLSATIRRSLVGCMLGASNYTDHEKKMKPTPASFSSPPMAVYWLLGSSWTSADAWGGF